MRLRLFLPFVFLLAFCKNSIAQNAPCTFRTTDAILKVTLEDAHIQGLTDDYIAEAKLFDISGKNANKPKLLISSTVGGDKQDDFKNCDIVAQINKQVLVLKTFYSSDGGKHFVHISGFVKKIQEQYPEKKDLKTCYPELLNDSVLLLQFSTVKNPKPTESFVCIRGDRFQYAEGETRALINLLRMDAARRIKSGSLEPQQYKSSEAAASRNHKVQVCYGEGEATGDDKAKEALVAGSWGYLPVPAQQVEQPAGAPAAAAEMVPIPKAALGRKGSNTMLYNADHTMLRYYQVGDSVYKTTWHWRISNDSMIYAFKADYDDTLAIYNRIDKLTANSLVMHTIGRDNITEPELCNTSTSLSCIINAKPVYPGDAVAYFKNALKDFVPLQDYYHASFRFAVNCRGEVTHIKDHGYKPFDKAVGIALRRMTGWEAPLCNGRPFDTEAGITVDWNKGFIDVEIFQPR